MDRVSFKSLDKDFLKNHVKYFIDMCQRNMEGEYWNEHNFLSELPQKWQYSFIVADNRGIVRAFIIASEKEQSVHIHKFVVDAPFQKGGLGSRMLDHIIQQSPKSLTLKVRTGNERAISFYEKNGFTIIKSEQGMHSMVRS